MCVFSPLPAELVAMLVLLMTNGEPLGRNGRNLLLNRLARVCKGLHNVIGPSGAARFAALNRPVTFRDSPEFVVPGPENRVWWNDVKGRGVTDEALKILAAECDAITYLVISGRGVSDEGIACLAAKCTLIAILNVKACYNLTPVEHPWPEGFKLKI